jgi:hypothetical protein
MSGSIVAQKRNVLSPYVDLFTLAPAGRGCVLAGPGGEQSRSDQPVGCLDFGQRLFRGNLSGSYVCNRHIGPGGLWTCF